MAKKQGSTATVAEVIASKTPATITAPTEAATAIDTSANLANIKPSAPTPQMASEQVVLIEEKVHGAAASWSQSETRDAIETVKFAVSQVVGQAESKMAIGERFNKFAKDHGDDKAATLVKTTSQLGLQGLSESNIGLYRIRAVEMFKQFPNPLIRRFVLALTGGEGIIVRDESSDADVKPYILSPYYAQAITKHGKAPDTKVDETAEKYARVLCATAKSLRSQARSSPEDSRVTKKFKDFRRYLIGKSGDAGMISKHESLIWRELYSLVESVAQATSDFAQFEALLGKLDKFLDVHEQNHAQESRQPGKVA